MAAFLGFFSGLWTLAITAIKGLFGLAIYRAGEGAQAAADSRAEVVVLKAERDAGVQGESVAQVEGEMRDGKF